MIFIDNKYGRYYYNIISNAKSRTLPNDVYTETHHIIPRSLGGDNSIDNLVKLTAREHFICHRLLPKMTEGRSRRKMIFAQNMMLVKTKDQQRYQVTSRVYKKIKEEWNAINPFKDPEWQKENGKKTKGQKRSAQAIANIKATWTEERRKRHSEIGKGRPNPKSKKALENARAAGLLRRGKKSKPRSEDYKLHQSNIRKGIKPSFVGKKIKCIYCLDEFDPGNHGQHHGEKCKVKFGLPPARSRYRIKKSKEKPISVDGIIYNSLTEASAILGINVCTLSSRTRNKNFPNCFYLQNETPS
jgi:5-methylcytosine-specific restriction endonuclease McrA